VIGAADFRLSGAEIAEIGAFMASAG